jgi:FtsP/CotA-like multicopper oxidase with cupredoxin domain
MLLRAPQEAGTYTLASLKSKGISFNTVEKIEIAQFVVTGSAVVMGIPNKLPVPTREYPVIEKKDVVKHRTFVFAQGPRTDLLTGFGFTINGKLYDMTDVSIAPQVGTCEEWRIENTSNEAHPFHIHENSFQLIAVNDQPNNPMQVWDTFLIPPKTGNKNGSITFRIRFLEWFGKTVFHCHTLPHEDTGMMQNILMT